MTPVVSHRLPAVASPAGAVPELADGGAPARLSVRLAGEPVAGDGEGDGEDGAAGGRRPVGAGARRGGSEKRAARTRTADRPKAAPAKPRARRSGGEPPSLLRQLARIEQDGGDGILVFAEGETLAVTSLGKEFFPGDGYTKGDMMRYYARVAPLLLPAIDGRPLALKRYPNGIGGPSFFQHDPGEGVPDVVRTEQVPTEDGTELRLVGGDLATLLYTVQLGTVAVNAWHSRVGSLDSPDYAVLDLDPGAGVPFRRVMEVAAVVRAELERVRLHAVAKTSGATGLHVLVPLARRTTYEAAAALAEEVATRVTAARPDVATVERAIGARPPGSVYVDHMQNARGKTLASLWSVRARPGAPVSAPLSWRQVGPSLDPKRWTVATVPRQLARLAARWRDEFEVAEV
jgi:bifunctional non-homologous end joining protein LigD